MTRLAAILAIGLIGCGAPHAGTTTSQGEDLQMKTVGSQPSSPALLPHPPLLKDEAHPTASTAPRGAPAPVTLSPEDERVRASLPFTPAIAMDPVDGSKISMRASTPTFEHKGKIYYFSSEANRKVFAADPERFLKDDIMRF